MSKGYVHVYTGNGKGKTTSVIGIMVRAAGAGKKIYFGQFMKQGDYSEIKVLQERFPEITLEQYGGRLLLDKESEATDIAIAQEGIKRAKEALHSGKYDMVVLDEVNIVVFLEQVQLEQLIELIENRPENVELVLTGRYANEKIIEMADLVSEIQQVKHYFNNGVQARLGIEM